MAFFVFFDGNVWFPRVITLLFVFVIADELSFGFAWSEAAKHSADIVSRLNTILETKDYSQEVVLSILCDYQMGVAILKRRLI